MQRIPKATAAEDVAAPDSVAEPGIDLGAEVQGVAEGLRGRDHERQGHAGERAARDEAGRVEHPGRELGLLALAAFLLLSPRVDEVLHHSADPDRRRRRDREVGADRPGQRVRAGELRHERQEHADEDGRPRQVLREEALDHRRHERRLRGGQGGRADAVGFRGAREVLVELDDRQADDERGRDDADDEAPLLGLRRGADEEARLQVLGRRAGVGRGDADDRADAERRRPGRRRPSSRRRGRSRRSP